MRTRTKQQLANANENLAKAIEAIKGLSGEELTELLDDLQQQLNGTPIPTGEYLSIIEVCQYLKVGRTTVWRYTKMGILKPRKIGCKILYARADIDDYLKNGMSHEEH